MNFIEELLLDIVEKCFSVKCEKCLKPFYNKYNLRRHVNQVHEVHFLTENHFFNTDYLNKILIETKVYKCPDCEKGFNSSSNLSKHI